MLRSVRGALAVVVVLAAVACAKSEDKGTQGGSGGSGGSGGAQGGAGGKDGGTPPANDSGASPALDAMAAPKTCRDIRVCLFNCGTDMNCAAQCVSLAPPAARMQYQDIHSCSTAACPQQDEDCRCNQECLAGGQCSDLVDVCDEAISDPWCDVKCH
jgi:hypothetical protein